MARLQPFAEMLIEDHADCRCREPARGVPPHRRTGASHVLNRNKERIIMNREEMVNDAVGGILFVRFPRLPDFELKVERA